MLPSAECGLGARPKRATAKRVLQLQSNKSGVVRKASTCEKLDPPRIGKVSLGRRFFTERKQTRSAFWFRTWTLDSERTDFGCMEFRQMESCCHLSSVDWPS